jgi:plasmid stabilization system protein ParE
MPRRVVLSRRVRNWVDIETEYLAARSPAAAQRLRERVAAAQQLLGDHPRVGRRGGAAGTRRLVMVPYVMTYREIGSDIVIVDIRHSRQAERPLLNNTR